MPRQKPNDDDLDEVAKSINKVACATLEGLIMVARAIGELKPKPDSKPKVHFDFTVGPIILKERTEMPLELSLTNEQKVNVTVTPKTQSGKPAKLDGKPTWEVTSGGATLAVADDGLSADIISSDDDLSDSLVQISADADLGEGVETIADTVLVHTAGANASNLGLVAGTPVLK